MSRLAARNCTLGLFHDSAKLIGQEVHSSFFRLAHLRADSNTLNARNLYTVRSLPVAGHWGILLSLFEHHMDREEVPTFSNKAVVTPASVRGRLCRNHCLVRATWFMRAIRPVGRVRGFLPCRYGSGVAILVAEQAAEGYSRPLVAQSWRAVRTCRLLLW